MLVRNARPFLKWAGGKSRFIQKHADVFPYFSGKYLEPFAGSGAVFFHLARTQRRPFEAYLGDINAHLIRAYIDVRDRVREIDAALQEMQRGYIECADRSSYYYEVREQHNARHPRTDSAAFIFLNRTCWNGLWRVNEQGAFNVPYGQPKSLKVVPSTAELLAAAAALQRVHLRTTSWQNTLGLAEPGDFVFLDPPYYSDLLNRDSSTKYDRAVFPLSAHERMAAALADLKRRNIDFILTNSGEAEMIDLYRSHGLSVQRTEMPRSINSKASERGAVPEIIVSPGTQPDAVIDWATQALRERFSKLTADEVLPAPSKLSSRP